MGTLGRFEEVRNFFETATHQTLRDFEIIVVDQNPSEELVGLCANYQDRLHIQHIRIDRRGLSIARNYGLRAATGEIIAFPDDDCEYPADLLECVNQALRDDESLGGLTAISRDKTTGRVSNGRFSLKSGIITPHNLWQRHISYTIFLRKEICDRVGGMDELFGAGAKWAGGEESDYLLRALHCGAKVMYRPDLYVNHPDHVKVYDLDAITHAYVCAVGFGALAKKHFLMYGTFSQIEQGLIRILRSVAGFLLYIAKDRGRSGCYVAHIRGWFTGFFRYPGGRDKIVQEQQP